MEEVSARLGWAWEPREVTPGRRPVMEIAGIDQRFIGWQSTRRQQIADAKSVLVAACEEKHGHAPGERADCALDRQAADRTRPPELGVPLSLTELRTRWRTSAIRVFGADVVDQLVGRARAAAAAVWARVRPVVDVVLAALDTVAVTYVMRGVFKDHLLLAYTRRCRPHEPGLDEQIVQYVVDDYTRPAGRGRIGHRVRPRYDHAGWSLVACRGRSSGPVCFRCEAQRWADAFEGAVSGAGFQYADPQRDPGGGPDAGEPGVVGDQDVELLRPPGECLRVGADHGGQGVSACCPLCPGVDRQTVAVARALLPVNDRLAGGGADQLLLIAPMSCRWHGFRPDREMAWYANIPSCLFATSPSCPGLSRTRTALVDRGCSSYGSDRGAEREAR